MGAQGTAVLDFTSTPAFEASVVVTGQTGIIAGSHVEAFWMKEALTEEYDMAPSLIELVCGNIVAGTGFTIYANCKTYAQGSITVRWVWN